MTEFLVCITLYLSLIDTVGILSCPSRFLDKLFTSTWIVELYPPPDPSAFLYQISFIASLYHKAGARKLERGGSMFSLMNIVIHTITN